MTSFPVIYSAVHTSRLFVVHRLVLSALARFLQSPGLDLKGHLGHLEMGVHHENRKSSAVGDEEREGSGMASSGL